MQDNNTPNRSQPQQPPQPAYVPQPPTPAAPAASNDGHVVGIIGLVLAFVCLWPIGIVLSIISIVQAGKARASKTLGIVGLVLNILGIFVSVILVAITMVAYSGIQDRAKTSAAQSAANSVSKHAEAYYALSDPAVYPSTIADFEEYPESSLKYATSDSITIVEGTAPDTGIITYKQCDAQSAQVSYYNVTTSRDVILPLGNASSIMPC